MNESSEQPADIEADDAYSIKGLMLTAVLVLPLGFFLWFYLSGVLVLPSQWLLEWLLQTTIGDTAYGVARNAYLLDAEFLVDQPAGVAGSGQAIAALTLNPMIYGYGMALVGGLIFCVPLSGLQRAMQLAVVYGLVTLIQVWGCFWELLKDLALSQVLGAEGVAMAANAVANNEIIAFCYQFGYLVLPAVVPIVAWIILNRSFIEGLVQPGVFARR